MADRIEQIVKLMFAVKRTMHEQKDASCNCSHLQLMTLFFIKETNPLMKDIARFLGITPPSATSLMNSLLKLNLVERKEDENDRRIVRISITAEGKKFLQQHKKQATEKMRKVLQKLSDKEQQQFIAILSKLTN